MEQPELRRSLGTTSAVMITVGSIIGSGIFFKPLDISRALPDPMWIFAGWTIIGLVCLCGAFAFAELVDPRRARPERKTVLHGQ